MPLSIREADLTDLDEMVRLLVTDGMRRQATDRTLWKLDADADDKVRSALKAAMESENPTFRQKWLLAEDAGKTVGVTHSILLPVPPIYAGEFGPPGLLMEDCLVVDGAPDGTAEALLSAAEADLFGAGAAILLGSSVAGGAWASVFTSNAYEPLTLYFAKAGLRAERKLEGVRRAQDDDIANIVVSSAENRRILFDLNGFWKPHPEADARFGTWMIKSLSLSDRDMFVSEAKGALTGYAISHPATPLHFPSPHDIRAVGVIDDYHHADMSDPVMLQDDGKGASRLLWAAEAALEARGDNAALVVCPAAWISKIAVLEAAGYTNAITWYIKRRD